MPDPITQHLPEHVDQKILTRHRRKGQPIYNIHHILDNPGRSRRRVQAAEKHHAKSKPTRRRNQLKAPRARTKQYYPKPYSRAPAKYEKQMAEGNKGSPTKVAKSRMAPAKGKTKGQAGPHVTTQCTGTNVHLPRQTNNPYPVAARCPHQNSPYHKAGRRNSCRFRSPTVARSFQQKRREHDARGLH